MRATLAVLIALPWLLSAAHAAEAAAAGPAASDVDAVFANFDSTVTPGCALGVYRHDGIVYERGYGMANLEYGIAISPTSIFRIASTSKQFTAMAIALLAEAGKLSLDDNVHKFFPEMPDYGHPITLRDLVYHMSGIRDYITMADLAEWGGDYSIADSVAMIINQRELNFPPRSKFQYSNSNYLLLAQIVEKVTGESLRVWARKNIFTPLGMKNTHYHDDHTHLVPLRADGYAPLENGGYRRSTTILDHVGDGGIFTNVEDLWLWYRNWQNNRLGKGRSELLDLLLMRPKLADGETSHYAFGLFIDHFHGVTRIWHLGGFAGYVSGLARFPDRDLGIAVLCNTSEAPIQDLVTGVAEVYLADAVKADEAAKEEQRAEDDKALGAALTPAQLEALAGWYWNEDEMMFRELVVRDGTLVFRISAHREYALRPVSANRFFMVGSPLPVEVRFAASNVMELDVGDNPTTVFKAYEPAEPSLDELTQLAGVYTCPDLNYAMHLEVSDGALKWHRRDEEVAFEPRLPGIFTEDTLSLRFDLGEDGSPMSLRLGAFRTANILCERQAQSGDTR